MVVHTFAPGAAGLGQLRDVYFEGTEVGFEGDWRGAAAAARDTVARKAEGEDSVYGVNTGFGLLARTRIDKERLLDLQRRLVRSHSVGVGEPLDGACVRLVLALKANALGRGFSGVRPEIVEKLLVLLKGGAHPVIPAQGSVGASGDLAPLAHLAAVLMGEGEAFDGDDRVSGAEALSKLACEPFDFEPKEGLALLNGTQVSTALALGALFRLERVFKAALVAGAMSVDAAMGSTTPFDERIQALRGHAGQSAVAGLLRDLLAGSDIRDSHINCDRVQDPYSLRCQPQVMGACLDQMRYAADILAREANAVTDNPLVFTDTDEILSGGNFHAEPVAFAADALAIAIAEIGNISERRTAMLIDSNISGLPPFLTEDSGVNSGFMIAQVSAAALASENRMLAHPASVDNIPTSANQEDHVSMATHGACRLGRMIDNLAAIVAIELLAAAQGLDFHKPMRPSPTVSKAMDMIRAGVPFYERDRVMAPDMAWTTELVLGSELSNLIGADLIS